MGSWAHRFVGSWDRAVAGSFSRCLGDSWAQRLSADPLTRAGPSTKTSSRAHDPPPRIPYRVALAQTLCTVTGRRIIPPVLLLTLFAGFATVGAQPLPDGEFYGDQQFDPTVEVLVAAGNGLLAGYNGYLLLRGRRRQFVAGAAVILGSIGLAIGLRDEANYPTADLLFGAAAVTAGAAQMLAFHPAASGLRFRVGPLLAVAGPVARYRGIGPEAGIKVVIDRRRGRPRASR